MSRRVAVTGIGTLNACGEGQESFWRSAIGLRSGISDISQEAIGPLPVKKFGSIPHFDPSKYVSSRKSLKVMCRDIRLAVAASYLAREDAGLANVVIDAERTGTCIGAGLFNHDLEELSDTFRNSLADDENFDARRFGEEGMSKLFPLWLLKYLPNMPACHISIAHDLRGPSNTITADSAGSAAAIEEACHVIERDMADMMFCGAAESRRNPQGLLRLVALGVMNTNGSPQSPYPVFSQEDSGLVMGEGGCVLILEELEQARKRDARIYAEIVSVYSSADWAGSDEEEEGWKIRAATMHGALSDAKIRPADVDAIHLNANGILRDDLLESRAIEEVFGSTERRPVLVSTKGLTGYLGFAAASTESALAAMSLMRGRLIPSGDDERSLLKGRFTFSKKDTSGSRVRYILVNQFSPGMSHHTIVLKTVGDGS